MNIPWTCLQCWGFNRLTGCYFTTSPLSFMVSAAQIQGLEITEFHSSIFSLSTLTSQHEQRLNRAIRATDATTQAQQTRRLRALTSQTPLQNHPPPDPHLPATPGQEKSEEEQSALHCRITLHSELSSASAHWLYKSCFPGQGPVLLLPCVLPPPAQSPKSKDTKQTHPPEAAKTNATKDNV